MPLFMDLHKASDYNVKPTIDEIKTNHIADLKVQEKYGVKFLQYWINEEAGLVFCLMEAPDKESCAAVHREAHGNMPCNVIELKGGDYKSYMGDQSKANSFDIVERIDGTLDSGFRIILVADFLSFSGDDHFQENIDGAIQKFDGRLISKTHKRETIIFSSAKQAIECALNLIKYVEKLNNGNDEIRIGISGGDPVTTAREIFDDVIKQSNKLCDIAQNKQIVISSSIKEIARSSALQNYKNEQSVKILTPAQEHFLNQLTDAIYPLISDAGNGIEDLCKTLGMSKSGLYRNIQNLAGISVNGLLQELRMQKAFKLIKNKSGNITQISLDVGYNNPSYFAKTFRTRFGQPPFKVLKPDY